MIQSGLLLTDIGHMDYYPITITKLEDGKFTVLAEGISYLSEEDRERFVSDETENYNLTYEWEGNKVSEEEYDANIKKIYDLDNSKRPERGYVYDEIMSILSTGKCVSADHRYELILQDVTWSEAQEICHNKGGYLATITSPDEADIIAELIYSENKKDNIFYVGYRSCEWVGDEFMDYRWINSDGSYTVTMLNGLSAYGTPDYETIRQEWRHEDNTANCGIVKYYDETKQIYVFEGPDELSKVSPAYVGKIGFICEYDN